MNFIRHSVQYVLPFPLLCRAAPRLTNRPNGRRAHRMLARETHAK
ncbi:hypothetical protein BURPS406E_K0532 [Burkholderia pseudomallei 406e]|nr:hypothetical protein BURPS305_4314 [Burkholderia pseudomallei 305]EDO86370.1 hypothetical protein BURPS406E_K0532 [Burkholderia pseudomallei 406e]EEC36218.1 conserved hypothetical protein [Burkholderia pseudomallei 576]EES47476.1 hypothetical protein BMAPRL20_A2740 [Burkholderia mallei PRL-20]